MLDYSPCTCMACSIGAYHHPVLVLNHARYGDCTKFGIPNQLVSALCNIVLVLQVPETILQTLPQWMFDHKALGGTNMLLQKSQHIVTLGDLQ